MHAFSAAFSSSPDQPGLSDQDGKGGGAGDGRVFPFLSVVFLSCIFKKRDTTVQVLCRRAGVVTCGGSENEGLERVLHVDVPGGTALPYPR